MRATLSLPLFALLAISLVSGCPKGGTTPVADGKNKGGTHSAGGSDAGAKEQAPAGAIDYASASQRPCMLHREAGGYFQCLSGADGQCFHYGAVCHPESQCMFDATSGLHKLCSELREGKCLAFRATCQPEDACMFSPDDGRYRICEAPRAGACDRYAALCVPTAGL